MMSNEIESHIRPTPGASIDQGQLYQRILAFRFDAGIPAFPFAERLSRDNGWSRSYTARVIHEYRRFAFLAVVAGHPVTPSDQVDQAWHLHLLYTRNYWENFCKGLLGRPLHHGPTEGGQAEREKFDHWYRMTLESYRRFFGEAPPADIWPAPNIRFGEDIHHLRVNTRRYWIIPKPRLKRFKLVGLLVTALRALSSATQLIIVSLHKRADGRREVSWSIQSRSSPQTSFSCSMES